MNGILLDSVLFEATVLNSLFWFVLYLICDDRFDYCRIDKEGGYHQDSAGSLGRPEWCRTRIRRSGSCRRGGSL